jgi:RND family efflux transporter MFP subunit
MGRSRRLRRVLAAVALLALLAWVAAAAAVRLQERMNPPPPASPPPLAVETRTLVAQPFAPTRSYRGTVHAHERVVLAAQLTALVEAVPRREGQRVAKGELLVRLNDAELTREIDRLDASARRIGAELDYWRAQLERNRRLHNAGTIGQRELDDSERMVASLEASLDETRHTRAAAATRRTYAQVHAPFAGWVQAVHALPGELATPGKPLLELVGLEGSKIVLAVPERELIDLAPGMAARVEVPAAGGVWQARIERIQPALDEATRSTLIEIDLPPQAAGVRPGMRAHAKLQTGETTEVLLVPQHVLRGEPGASGVFVVEDGRATWRPVVTGPSDGSSVVVTEGLRAGEELVVTAHPALAEGQALRVTSGWRTEP